MPEEDDLQNSDAEPEKAASAPQLSESAPSKEIVERLEPFVQPGRANEAARVVQSMLIQQSHSGPLPSAREFKLYEATLVGAGDRIIAMAEREQTHRHSLESSVVKADRILKGRGQWFALAALLVSLLVVALFAAWGHPIEGASLGGAVIIGVVALFLGQKWLPKSSVESDDTQA